MTHNFQPLEDYFQRINQPSKEPNMIDYLKAHFASFFTPPVYTVETTVQVNEPTSKDFYSIEMFTEGYDDIPDKYSCLKGDHSDDEDYTWMALVDKFADMLSYHYGYNIKEQIYYSVQFPINCRDENGKELSGYGRELNDEKLQLLLLTHPELYQAGESL